MFSLWVVQNFKIAKNSGIIFGHTFSDFCSENDSAILRNFEVSVMLKQLILYFPTPLFIPTPRLLNFNNISNPPIIPTPDYWVLQSTHLTTWKRWTAVLTEGLWFFTMTLVRFKPKHVLPSMDTKPYAITMWRQAGRAVRDNETDSYLLNCTSSSQIQSKPKSTTKILSLNKKLHWRSN